MISLIAPDDILSNLSAEMRRQRIAQDMTQVHLAARANVSLSVLRKFERTGKISLESFVKLSFVLGFAKGILNAVKVQNKITSLDDFLIDENKPARKYAYSPRKNKND